MTRRGLVLGGGGVAGIAWETGLLAGLSESGVQAADADRVIGTSAGSTVAAQLTSGVPLQELYDRQADPALQTRELVADLDPAVAEQMFGAALQEDTDPAALRRRIGALALAAPTVSEAERREVIEARLPVHAWPETDLRIVAVDAATGEPRVFDRESGVGLVDAVAASCAVPGTWPPVTIGGARYIDGGVRSMENADLASGCERVLVLKAMTVPDVHELDDQVAALRAEGSTVTVVEPDEASLEALGINPLDPAVRGPAAKAGFAQGQALAVLLAVFWR
ncbi:patatin-like phospholipase family protein [Amycolatopsis acidicola]|uniref:Patatin-like phospholipase family protein n=1 Tax=Amycolatopsis acidicola TaxID=2596893 RepID=A0A5N0VKT4_9PSEU|nr:patatin-like phospholipase family protein [Amycolatopsis acidicola]KAA9166318.1 patatin-like phospholipase family protein [Amycolatopsis acidicola]